MMPLPAVVLDRRWDVRRTNDGRGTPLRPPARSRSDPRARERPPAHARARTRFARSVANWDGRRPVRCSNAPVAKPSAVCSTTTRPSSWSELRTGPDASTFAAVPRVGRTARTGHRHPLQRGRDRHSGGSRSSRRSALPSTSPHRSCASRRSSQPTRRPRRPGGRSSTELGALTRAVEALPDGSRRGGPGASGGNGVTQLQLISHRTYESSPAASAGPRRKSASHSTGRSPTARSSSVAHRGHPLVLDQGAQRERSPARRRRTSSSVTAAP